MKIIFTRILSCIMFAMRIFPIKRNKIIFSNFAGKGYGDNPKYIYQVLSNIADIDAVWIVSDDKFSEEIPKEIRVVKNKSFKKFYELATAKVWVDNCRKSEYILKRKGQFYIMTWHAGLCIKKVEKDAEAVLGRSYVRYARADSQKIDLMVSNSKWCTELYKKSFWYSGKIVESGSPRNDFLLEKNQCNCIKERLGIDDSKKVAIYAPTFRKDKALDSYDIDIEKVLIKLSQKFDFEWVLILRLHPSVSKSIHISKCWRENVIDASDYGDVYEILKISDVLFTDYSSLIFDYALMKRPAFIFASDIDKYIEDRGFYFDLRMLPFPFANSNDALIHNIENFNMEDYCQKLNMFFNQVGLLEKGNASNTIAELIKEVIQH